MRPKAGIPVPVTRHQEHDAHTARQQRKSLANLFACSRAPRYGLNRCAMAIHAAPIRVRNARQPHVQRHLGIRESMAGFPPVHSYGGERPTSAHLLRAGNDFARMFEPKPRRHPTRPTWRYEMPFTAT